MSSPVYVKEFDYDLWTTEDGKCWARVRSTGEISEISLDVMRLLRSEEKQMWRHSQPLEENAGSQKRRSYAISHPLSLDAQPTELEQDSSASWYASPFILDDHAWTMELERKLVDSLSDREKDFYYNCILLGIGKQEYAKNVGVSAARVNHIFEQIKQKLKKLLFYR